MKRRTAFTLIELMVSIAVTSLLIVLLVSITSSVSNAWQRGEALGEVQANARGALNLMGRELQGALVDLDLGFRVTNTDKEPNNFRLTFLTRTKPKGDDVPALMKVCYQLAWADRTMLPEVVSIHDDKHPVPVLIRTESNDLTNVFIISKQTPADYWVREWGDIPPGGIKTAVQTGKDRTEVVAENVLGWRVTPTFWDSSMKQINRDKLGDEAVYYEKYLTSDKAPRALEVEMAILPSRAVGRASTFRTDWSALRQTPWLFDFQQAAGAREMSEVPETAFANLLRQNVKYFSGTFYLQSKTP